uniref:hypothetical protein n=1 Tax=Streptococcus pluranimalium TaxID=82348 RepID=UPI003F68CB99
MPSIIEELPKKAVKMTIKGFKFTKKKLDEYFAKVQDQDNERKWNDFLFQTQMILMQSVKQQINSDQFAYYLHPIFEEQEIILKDGRKSIQRVHVADDIIPICKHTTGIEEFQTKCNVFSFDIFGELEILKIKEQWAHYLREYGLYGICDTYKKHDSRRLVFIICDRRDKRSIKGALFRLKNS